MQQRNLKAGALNRLRALFALATLTLALMFAAAQPCWADSSAAPAGGEPAGAGALAAASSTGAADPQSDAAGPSPDATPQVEGTLEAYFLNVGQGDSEFLVLPNGKTMLIDAGEASAGDAIVWYIQDVLGYDRIDYLVATHPHSDHIGGMKTVLWSPIFIDQVFAPYVETDTETYWEFLSAAQTVGKTITPATTGLVIDQGDGLLVEVLSPAEDAAYEDLNDWSVIVRVTWGETTFLFTGDASYQVVDAADPGQIDVLKVGHHGSDTSTSLPMLQEMQPEIAVIEVGWGNSYGHPTAETVQELGYCEVETWRTDVDGVVVVESDGTNVVARSADTGATEPVSAAEIQARVDAEEAEARAQAEAEARAAAEAQAQAQAQAEAEAAQAAAQQAVAGQVVYITETGSKYHRDGCQYLRKSKIEVSKSDAINWGYEPCSRCF